MKLTLIQLDFNFDWRGCLAKFPLIPPESITKYVQSADQLRAFTSGVCKYYLSAASLGVAPNAILLQTNHWGKPYLANKHWNYKFNLAHSGKYVVMLEAQDFNGELGIDIEQINPDLKVAELQSLVFSPAECELICGEPANFIKLWAKKEALIKALGYGFATKWYQSTHLNLADCEICPDYQINTQRIADYYLSYCIYTGARPEPVEPGEAVCLFSN